MTDVPNGEDRGTQPQWDSDELFELWHNAGRTRTFGELVAEWKRLHPNERPFSRRTFQHYKDNGDFARRADGIDSDARKETDKRLARTIVKHRANVIGVSAHVFGMYAERLRLPVGDPDRIAPGDVEFRDAVEAAKLFELVTGGATERVGEEGRSTVSPEEIEAELEEIEIRALKREQGA